MKYTEYTFEHFDSASGAHKVQKWIDGPSVDFLDYTVNKNKDYQLSHYDANSLVFNFVRGDNSKRIFDIISSTKNMNSTDFWDALLDYNFNSNQKDKLLEFSKFLLDNNLLMSPKQAFHLVKVGCSELNTLLEASGVVLNFDELNFNDYCYKLDGLTEEQLNLLSKLGFKRNSEWDTTIKTLKDNNLFRYNRDDYPLPEWYDSPLYSFPRRLASRNRFFLL